MQSQVCVVMDKYSYIELFLICCSQISAAGFAGGVTQAAGLIYDDAELGTLATCIHNDKQLHNSFE